MIMLRADFPIFKNSTSNMDYLRGIVLAIYFFDYSLKDSESTLLWSATAISALPDLVRRLGGMVDALSQESMPLCDLLESVSGMSPSLVSVFDKLPSALVSQYSERLSDGASRSLISCLKVSYRALLADRWKRSHHRSRFSIHIRSYKSWLPVAEFDRGVSDTGRLEKPGGRSSATMKSRAVLTSKSRQAQEVAALTSTVGKLSNELASLNRKAKEWANSQRKVELEIRRLRKERKYDQQALNVCRTSLRKSLRKSEEQQAYNQSCINQQAHNLSSMSGEMGTLRNQVRALEEKNTRNAIVAELLRNQVEALEAKNARLTSDTALVQLSVSNSHESHLEALGYVNKSVADLSQNLNDLRDSVVLRSPNWFVNLLDESLISLPVGTESTSKLTLIGHLANLISKVEALQPVSTKLVKLTEAFRSLEFTVKEDASSRRRELELLYLPQRLTELRLQLHPILMQVRKLVPSLFPVHGANGWDLTRSADWLVEFPRFLADTFPQLRNFDSSDPTNSGWLQWMAYECFDVDLQSHFHMSDRVLSLPWDPYKLLGHCGDVSPEEF
jgi:hypothetical protein